MDNSNKDTNPVKEETKPEAPKKYLCVCIDCIGEWTRNYTNIETLQKDIIKYCRSGKAKYTVIE